MAVSQGELRGPIFIHEPTHHVDFSNSTGTRLQCSARGNPTPNIRWLLSDNFEALPVERVRLVLDNGTLIFPPFRAEDYRQDVHATVYRCTASNPSGTIVSRDVRLRAGNFGKHNGG
uniref:Ig-like domain-containing protein n=1 Tax=Strigamia maritima TaxID=126957 RepID=T1IJ01_STRMM